MRVVTYFKILVITNLRGLVHKDEVRKSVDSEATGCRNIFWISLQRCQFL